MNRIIAMACSLMLVLVVFGCEDVQDPVAEEVLMAPGGVPNGNGLGRGNAPHNGGCASYCARSVIHILKDGEVEVPVNDPAFTADAWEPFDYDGDGEVEKCLQEFMRDTGESMCHKEMPGICPEFDGDGDGVYDRCIQPGDGWGVWCRLMHGKDTHDGGH